MSARVNRSFSDRALQGKQRRAEGVSTLWGMSGEDTGELTGSRDPGEGANRSPQAILAKVRSPSGRVGDVPRNTPRAKVRAQQYRKIPDWQLYHRCTWQLL